jgi:hypothetical protein
MFAHASPRHVLRTILTACFLAFAWAGRALAAPEASRPGWLAEYLANPPAPWKEWRNALAPKGKPSAELVLATKGKTPYVIVIPKAPTGQERRAADELQLWLGEITGAEFPIVPDSEPARAQELVVGRTTREWDLASAPTLTAGPGRLDGAVLHEGYIIAVDGERIFLWGGENPGGPLPAVLAFLEEDLGVRWYEPALPHRGWDRSAKALNAKRWAKGAPRLPRAPDLRVAVVPRAMGPAFPIRCYVYQRSYNPWGLRNRVNGGYASQYGQHGYLHGGFFVHTFHYLVPPKKHFADHPEYYPLIKGKRQWEHAQLCLSNPEVATVAAETIASVLRRLPQSQHATKNQVSISAMDWLGDCECAECQEMAKQAGGYSGLQLAFVNRVAGKLGADYPWATITTLAYRQSKEPPPAGAKAQPNVAIRFCTDFGASFTWPYHSLRDTQIADLAEQQAWYTRWQQISPRMHLWIYPHQYRHSLAPMPNIRAVADNLRFFHERKAESAFVQQSAGQDLGREMMRWWIFAKLMWNPALDVEDLIRDFIWGNYGPAAPAVFEYERLLWEHNAKYTDFSRKRDWIHAIHEEEMYRHGFAEKARAILTRAEAAADSESIRRRIGKLKAGVVYVETVQLFMQMRDGETPPDVARYGAVITEFEELCAQLGIQGVGFFDGSRSIGKTVDWLAEMRKVWERRFDQRFLPPEKWGAWTFRWDLKDKGVGEKWFGTDVVQGEDWTPVAVPAFLAQTPAKNEIGYGWYRTTFTLPAGAVRAPVELQFGGVDEQAWVYVNGEYVGEQTLKSEFVVGQEVTVEQLWNRPFAITVKPALLKAGDNVLAVRIHNSAMNSGIHQQVRAYLPDPDSGDACDGAVLDEDFAGVKTGDIPAIWGRDVQRRGAQVFGRAEVSRHFVRNSTLHLSDQESHVAVWSKADDVLPASKEWAVQFDFRLTGRLLYKAADVGAIFGLKRGAYRSADYLPLVQLDNGGIAGKAVTLLGLGETLATELPPNQWHRLVIRRDGTVWHFYLNGELKKTVHDRDTDYRGYAFGSFRDWPHVAQDIHYAKLKIGNFVGAPAAE